MLPLLQSFQIHLASRRIVFHLFMLLFYVHGAPVAAISRLPLWVLGLVSLFSQFRPLLLVPSIVSVSTPHCFWKFLPRFGDLYWVVTRKQLFFFDIDRPVIDLSWKVAHCVVYTSERLISFGLHVPAPVPVFLAVS